MSLHPLHQECGSLLHKHGGGEAEPQLTCPAPATRVINRLTWDGEVKLTDVRWQDASGLALHLQQGMKPRCSDNEVCSHVLSSVCAAVQQDSQQFHAI